MASKKKPALKFDPAWCEQIRGMGRNGLVLSNYASALNMTIDDLQALAKLNKSLGEAISFALDLALAFHEEKLINPVPGGQAQLTLAFLKRQWPSLYAVDPKASAGSRSAPGELSPKESAKQMQEFFTGIHGIFYESAVSHFEGDDSDLVRSYLADMKSFQDRLVSGKFQVGPVYLD